MQQPRRACDCPIAGGAGRKNSQPARGDPAEEAALGPVWQSAVKCFVLRCSSVLFKAT